MEHAKDRSRKNEPHIKADQQRGDADAEDPREFAELENAQLEIAEIAEDVGKPQSAHQRAQNGRKQHQSTEYAGFHIVGHGFGIKTHTAQDKALRKPPPTQFQKPALAKYAPCRKSESIYCPPFTAVKHDSAHMTRTTRFVKRSKFFSFFFIKRTSSKKCDRGDNILYYPL